MHEEIFAEIQEAIENNSEDNIAAAAPRGNAKSTIISFALPIWCAVYLKKHYVLIISDTASQANDFLNNIKTEFEDNETLRSDFGSLIGDIWTNSDIILSNDVRIQALGAGKKVRGRRYKQYRPDLIIGDDLENDENTESPDQRKKMFNWWTKAVSKAGSEFTDKIVIGTIIHYDSLLNKLLKNPVYKTKKYQAVLRFSNSNLWMQWEQIVINLTDPNRLHNAKEFYDAHREEMLVGTKVLWPEKEDYYNLMLQRIADGPAAFSSEKQNEPLSDDERRFQMEWIKYYDEAELIGKDLYIVAAVDPSMGKAGGDFSSIIILGQDANGIVYVLACDMKRRHPDAIIDDTVYHYGLHHFITLGVEEVQFQEYFKDNLTKKIKDERIGITVVGIRTHSDKILRIQSLQPDVKNGRIRFRRDQQDLIEQLINFPVADNDDGPDSLQLGIGLLRRFSGIQEYYKEKAHEAIKTPEQSFIQNIGLQGSIR